ncbi:hypothetical protein GW923_01540 [Candidatus Pacearchaeota archaeon]|nr:hypothetical protein [Candidatus Pacearchaeota archaeon]OIO42302.1 MAG: hypothetical protein AUJ63_03425 [Candidatus Pacearchaeota archaeon CG1_02_35_32]
MKPGNLMWECDSCGKIEYGGNPPEECEECWKMNSFVQVDEDELDIKREANIVEKIKIDFDKEDEDADEEED